MNKFVVKKNLYEILTNAMQGVFIIIIINITSDQYVINANSKFLISSNIFQDICVCYLLGLVMNNFAIVIIEPILKKINFIKVATYDQFIKASKIDHEILIDSNIIVLYRTLMIISFLVYIFEARNFIILVISIIFFLSYRRQSKILFNKIQEICGE